MKNQKKNKKLSWEEMRTIIQTAVGQGYWNGKAVMGFRPDAGYDNSEDLETINGLTKDLLEGFKKAYNIDDEHIQVSGERET